MQRSLSTRTKIIISIVLVVFGVTMRFVPHLWNFTPVIAIALFAGVYLGRKYALVLPLLVMLISDAFLGFYDIGIILSVYGSIAMVGILGYWLKKYKSTTTVVASSIVASVLFFLVTNWSVWFFGAWYPAGIEGLMTSYAMGIPFFKNALLGNIVYTASLFGMYELGLRYAEKRIQKEEVVLQPVISQE